MLALAFSAAFGSLISGIVGWLDSNEPFQVRKFLQSVIAAIFSGAGAALLLQNTDTSSTNIILAFLSGAGVDNFSNRVVMNKLGKKR
mgnify:FL=1